MSVSKELAQRIEQEVSCYPQKLLAQAALELSKTYRQEYKSTLSEPLHQAAYLLTRMPATLAALRKVLSSIKAPITSLYDLGCGPGTGLWAAFLECPHLQRAHLVDQTGSLLAMAKRLAPIAVETEKSDLASYQLAPIDLALFAYSLGEVKNPEPLLHSAFTAASTLVIVEPGTPVGYGVILRARTFLLSQGAHIVAPCPHEKACPLKGEDWCHFSVRLPRSSLHRTLKSAELAYEDEKFSYLIVQKEPIEHHQDRILRHPLHHKGHSLFTLCTTEGERQERVVSRKLTCFKACKKLEWGDFFLGG